MQQSQQPPIQLRPLNRDDGAAWREIRLEALQSSPTAFESSFEEESARDLAAFTEWVSPATLPNVVIGAFQDDQLVGNAGFFVSSAIKSRHKETPFWCVREATIPRQGCGTPTR